MSATDFVSDAVNEAMGGDDAGDPQMGAGEAQSGESASESEGSGEEAAAPEGAPAAPVAPAQSFSGVTREEFAAMQRESMAELKRLREEFAKPTPPKSAAQESNVDPEAEAFHAKYLRTPAGWTAYVKELQQDPSMYERSINAVVARSRAADFKALKTLQDEFKTYREATDKELAEARGHRVIADHRYAESPRWQKHGKQVLASFEEGLFNAGHKDAIERAFQYHEQMAKSKGASPQQAAAAGAQAAQAKATQIATTKGKQPEPRDEASLREGKRGASAHATPPATSGKGKKTSNDKWLESMIGNAVDQALKGSK